MAETFNMIIPEGVQEQLEQCRQVAEDQDQQGGEVHSICFGGEDVQINPRRPKRGRWSIQNDDFQVTFRSPRMDWCVTVRYGAAGLWEYGLAALRDRVLRMLTKELTPKGDDWQRVSEAHWAWDFYSPEFSEEMRPSIMEQVVCHSSSKKSGNAKIDLAIWGRGVYLETLDIGKRAPLHIQVYDKGREITEASGKTWMVKLWEREGFYPPDDDLKHVWRIEVRMRGDGFLRERGILRLAELEAVLPELLAEALFTRRLTSPNDDTNRWRWPMHPLWVSAYRASERAEVMAPLGRQVTQAADAIRATLLKTAGGCMRTAGIADVGAFDPIEFRRIAREAVEMVLEDPELDAKSAKTEERLKYINEAR